MALRVRWFIRSGPLILAAAIALASWNRLERSLTAFISYSAPTVALAGLLVGWRLKRSRLVFAFVVLGLAYELVTAWAPRNPAAFQLAAMLVPINLAAIALLPERGVFTIAGWWQWVAILTQTAAVALLLAYAPPAALVAALRHAVLPSRLAAWTPVAQWALIAFGAAGAALAAGRAIASDTTNPGYLWTLAAAFLAFHSGRGVSDRTLYFAAAGAILITVAIEYSYTLAYQDGLTGLPGRRALDEALKRLGGAYCVAMIDVDRFKAFNDTYGHDVGDQVLRTVATRLAEVLPHGTVFRYGGEEFAALLPNGSLDACVSLMEKAREAVARRGFTVRARVRPAKKPAAPRKKRRSRQQQQITVSIGIAERDGRHQKPEQVIGAADRALYRAKEAGRNRVEQ